MSCDVTGFARGPRRSPWSLFTRYSNPQKLGRKRFIDSSSEDQQQNEESGIDVLEVRIRPFFPYQDEPVTQFAAHMDEDEMDSQTMKTTFLRQLCGPVSLEG